MQFIVTTLGQAAITAANNSNAFVTLNTFKLGSASGYAPSAADTNLHGTVLHTGLLTTPLTINPDTKKFKIQIGTSVGDFDFGEVGLFLPNGDLFALVATQLVNAKRKSTNTSRGNSLNIDCYLSQHQLSSAFTYDVSDSYSTVKIPEVTSIDDLVPPNIADNNVYVCHDTALAQHSLLAIKDKDLRWKFDGYDKILYTGSIGTSGATSMTTTTPTGLSSIQNGEFILQITSGTHAGYSRIVKSVAGSNVTWSTPFSPPIPIGSEFEIYTINRGPEGRKFADGPLLADGDTAVTGGRAKVVVGGVVKNIAFTDDLNNRFAFESSVPYSKNYTFVHGLNTLDIEVTVSDQSGEIQIPASIVKVDANTVTINLSIPMFVRVLVRSI